MKSYGRCSEHGLHLNQLSFKWDDLPFLAAWLLQRWAHEMEHQQPEVSPPAAGKWNKQYAHLAGGPAPWQFEEEPDEPA